MTSSGSEAFEACADAIAERVCRRLVAVMQQNKSRLLDVEAAAEYIGRSPAALRHLISRGKIPCVRRDGRVQLDRKDLDNWLEMGKTHV